MQAPRILELINSLPHWTNDWQIRLYMDINRSRWESFSEKQRAEIRMDYYRAIAEQQRGVQQ